MLKGFEIFSVSIIGKTDRPSIKIQSSEKRVSVRNTAAWLLTFCDKFNHAHLFTMNLNLSFRLRVKPSLLVWGQSPRPPAACPLTGCSRRAQP